MRILEKLKDLVNSLEEEQNLKENQVDQEKSEDPIWLQESSIEEQQDTSEGIEEFPSYLECNSQETFEVMRFLENERMIKIILSEKLMEFEDIKTEAFDRIAENKKNLLNKLNDLRLEYGIPEEGWSVQLPSSPEDKVSFQKE